MLHYRMKANGEFEIFPESLHKQLDTFGDVKTIVSKDGSKFLEYERMFQERGKCYWECIRYGPIMRADGNKKKKSHNKVPTPELDKSIKQLLASASTIYTIKDLAYICNVSHATIHFCMKHPTRISAETKYSIHNIVEKLMR